LLFRSKEYAETWRGEMQMPAGELLTVEQVWELSKLWYQDRLSPEFKGRSIAEAHEIFEKLGLNTDFWRFDISS
jgi:hypothetical protein